MLRKITKYFVLSASIVVALCLLLSYLSAFVSPATFWPLAFFGLVFQLFFVLNVILGIVWLCLKKKYVFIHLAVILVGFPYLGYFVQFSGKNAPEGEKTIKILSYNVHTFNLIKDECTYNEVAGFLNTESADVVCLQEFFSLNNGRHSEKEFIEQLDDLPYHHIFYNAVNKNSSFGLAIFSRYPIVGTGEFQFPKSGNAAIYVDVDINGKVLRVYNNHLQSTKFSLSKLLSGFSNEDKRINELVNASSQIKQAFIKRAEQVDRVSSHISSSPYPAVVCGDFNDTPVSYTYRKMKGDLKDAFIVAGKGIPSTYRGFFPSFRIDYIFYDARLNAYSYKVGDITYSDHYPISVELAGF